MTRTDSIAQQPRHSSPLLRGMANGFGLLALFVALYAMLLAVLVF